MSSETRMPKTEAIVKMEQSGMVSRKKYFLNSDAGVSAFREVAGSLSSLSGNVEQASNQGIRSPAAVQVSGG